MQDFTYNPYNIINSIQSPKKPSTHSFKSLTIQEVIVAHDIGSRLTETFLLEFISYREYNFHPFSDNIYLAGLKLLLKTQSSFQKNISNRLIPLLEGSQEIYNRICCKLLGKPFNMLLIEEFKGIFDQIEDLHDFFSFLQESINYKERRMCEILVKILCLQQFNKLIQGEKHHLSLESVGKMDKLEEFLMSEKTSFLENEAKYVFNSLCEICLAFMSITTFDCDNCFYISESLPSSKDLAIQNHSSDIKIVIFNDSKFQVYFLEKIQGNNRLLMENIKNFSLKHEESKSDKNIIEPKKQNKIEKLKKDPHLEEINYELPKKTLCLSCSGQFIFDDYNRFGVVFIDICTECRISICSFHKTDPKLCTCFCGKCLSRTEKRVNFKRSSDFASEEFYEFLECKKCNLLFCFHCRKKLKSYEELCHCQCLLCAGRIINRFEEIQDRSENCIDCSFLCKKCLVRKDGSGNYLYICDGCKEHYCRSCINEGMVQGKEIKYGVKNLKVKGEAKIKNDNVEKIRLLCSFCQNNKNKNGVNKEKKGKIGLLEKIFK